MKRKTVVALLATMTLTAGGTATAFAMNAGQFSDVKASSSYYSYIETVVDAGLMNAESEEEFGVAETETRGEFIRTLHTLAKSPLTLDDSRFEDVKGTDIALAVRWAENEKLFEGLNSDFFVEGKFDTDKELTREEMAVILYNYGKYIDGLDMSRGVGSYDSFSDHEDNKVSDTYAEQVKWAVGNKLLNGDDRLTDEAENNLRPTAKINKVEVAEALYQYISFRDMLNAEQNTASKNDISNEAVNNQAISEDNNNVINTTTPTDKGEKQETSQPDVEVPDKGDTEEPDAPHDHNWVDNMVEVKHEEKGHWEKVEVKPAWVENIKHEAVYEDKYVVDEEAQYDTIHHDAVYEDQWVVDKPAWVEEIKHDEEGHFEPQIVNPGYWKDVLVSKEEGHYEEVEISPAWEEKIQHEAVYETKDVVVQEAWDEPVYGEEIRSICNVCSADCTGNEYAHADQHLINDGIPGGFHDEVKQVQIDTIRHPAVTEPQQVLVKEAWTETITHPADTEQQWVVDKEAVYDKEWVEPVWASVWVVDKEAWVEKINHKEEGHYENVKVKDAWNEEVLISEEKGHIEKVLVKEAWTETIEHEAEYEDQYVIDQAAYSEWVSQGEICSECGETR